MCLAIYKPAYETVPADYLQTAFEENPDGAGFAYHDPVHNQVVILKGYQDFNKFYRAYQHYEQYQMIIHFRWTTHGDGGYDNCHPFKLTDGALIHNGIIECTKDKAASYSRYSAEYVPAPVKEQLPGLIPEQCIDWENCYEVDKGLWYDATNKFHFDIDNEVDWSTSHDGIDLSDDADLDEPPFDIDPDTGRIVGYTPPSMIRKPAKSDTRIFVDDYLTDFVWQDMLKNRKMIEKIIGWSKLVTLHDNGQYIIFNEHMGHWLDGVWYSNRSYLKGKY